MEIWRQPQVRVLVPPYLKQGLLFTIVYTRQTNLDSLLALKTVLLCPALCWSQGSELRSSIYTAYALCIRPSSQFCFVFMRPDLLAVKPRQTSVMHYSCFNHCSAEITDITTTLSLLTSHSEEEIQSGSVGKVPAISAWRQATWVQISQYKLGVMSCTQPWRWRYTNRSLKLLVSW